MALPPLLPLQPPPLLLALLLMLAPLLLLPTPPAARRLPVLPVLRVLPSPLRVLGRKPTGAKRNGRVTFVMAYGGRG